MPGFLDWIIDVHLGVLPAMFVAMAVAAVFAAIVGVALMRLGGVQAAISTLACSSSSGRHPGERHGHAGRLDDGRRAEGDGLWDALIWALIAIVVVAIYQDSTRGMRLRRRARTRRPRARSASRSSPSAGSPGSSRRPSRRPAAPSTATSSRRSPPINFEFRIVFLTVAMLVIGGLYSLSGAVIGVIFVSVVQEVLRRVEVNGFGPIGAGESPG